MPTELKLRAHHQGGLRVLAETEAHAVQTDYPLQPGQETEGMTSLQLLLAALATCSANGLRLILGRRMNLTVTDLDVEARAERRDEHPTILTKITLAFRIRGEGLEEGVVRQALQIAETQLCPVWVMLRGGTPIETTLEIVND
jgi:uncharacterized OsmC-like protein